MKPPVGDPASMRAAATTLRTTSKGYDSAGASFTSLSGNIPFTSPTTMVTMLRLRMAGTQLKNEATRLSRVANRLMSQADVVHQQWQKYHRWEADERERVVREEREAREAQADQ